jgi:hypothetical protein
MHTKKHNKKHNKRKHSRTKLFSGGGGINEEIEEIEQKPSYIKYTLLILGISTCYIVLKLTKG